MLPAGDSRMEWMLCLVGMGIDGQSRSSDVKDWQPYWIAWLFGEVRLKLPRFRCTGCGCGETGVNWPSHRRLTPELSQMQARLLATYRKANRGSLSVYQIRFLRKASKRHVVSGHHKLCCEQ